ncbi:hypothetical protein BC834DRAFT_80119 [Gloeopeniophorella convolvens]|nr:hypothetical protein BC834DRAFT_80119 [Gloeopeniophorella convolvens]
MNFAGETFVSLRSFRTCDQLNSKVGYAGETKSHTVPLALVLLANPRASPWRCLKGQWRLCGRCVSKPPWPIGLLIPDRRTHRPGKRRLEKNFVSSILPKEVTSGFARNAHCPLLTYLPLSPHQIRTHDRKFPWNTWSFPPACCSRRGPSCGSAGERFPTVYKVSTVCG